LVPIALRNFQEIFGVEEFFSVIQSNLVDTDTEGAIEIARIKGGAHIKRVEIRETVRAFFPQGHSKLSVLSGCP